MKRAVFERLKQILGGFLELTCFQPAPHPTGDASALGQIEQETTPAWKSEGNREAGTDERHNPDAATELLSQIPQSEVIPGDGLDRAERIFARIPHRPCRGRLHM